VFPKIGSNPKAEALLEDGEFEMNTQFVQEMAAENGIRQGRGVEGGN
jgi:hypothetical protein